MSDKEKADVKLLLEALIVGICTGIVIGLFRYGISQTTGFWLTIFRLAHNNAMWFIAIVAGFIATAVIAGYFVKQYPHVGGSGIPEVKLQLEGKLSLRWFPILWRKFISSILVIGTGLFLGPEGPSLQLGSNIGQGVSEGFKQNKTNSRVLLATGAASGLSAAFGAPLSGVLFMLETIFHNFSPRVGINALAGALASNFVTSNIFGQQPVLAIAYDHPFPVVLYWHLLILGVILGLLSHLYKIGLFSCKKLYAKIKFLPHWLLGLIPLAILIPIAYFLPLITGPGSRLILDLPKMVTKTGWIMLGTLVFFYLLRLVFSIVSYDSGLPSGVFLPVLTMGALIGAIYGLFMVQLHLLPRVLVVNLIIFSMAGSFAAVIRAPFTAIILITEMVGSLLHLMPLAVVAFIALFTDQLLGGKPIYDSLAQAMEGKNGVSKTASGYGDQLTVPVYESSQLVGKKVAEIKWPKGTLVKVIHRSSEDIIPNGQTEILAGDMLVLAVDSGQRGEVYNAMIKLQEVKFDG